MTLALADFAEARLWLRLALVPAVVWAASLAARRWGHAVSGYLGGMPLIGGPITLYLALDYGAGFAQRAATMTLAAILGQAAHQLAFAAAARHARWPIALAAGWSSFLAVALALAWAPPEPALAAVLALGGLVGAWRWLPRLRGTATRPAVPRAELYLRLAAAFLLAAAIVVGARVFGPLVSGILLSVPVTGSIMPPFTLALYGPDAVVRLARGFIVGLSGFTAFYVALSFTLLPAGVAAAFVIAALAALGAVWAVATGVRRADAS